MIFPKEFYYRIKQGIDYKTYNTGLIDIQRLLNACPDYWISPEPAEVWAKKSLILADWSAIHWSKKKIRQVIQALTYCIEEGFSIYLFQGATNTVVPLSMKQLKSLKEESIRWDMQTKRIENIIEAAAIQHHLAADAIHILDDYGVRCMLNPDACLEGRYISIDDITHVCFDDGTPYTNYGYYEETIYTYLDIFSFIQSIKPQYILLDAFSGRHNKALQKIRAWFPDLPIIPRYKSIDTCLYQTPHIWESFWLRGSAIAYSKEMKPNVGQCQNVHTLSFPENITCKNVSDILSAHCNLTALRRIIFDCGGHLTDDLDLVEGSLHALESLYLPPTASLSQKHVLMFLKAAPNLKKLVFQHRGLLGANVLEESQFDVYVAGSLPRLESLNLETSGIQMNGLEYLLKAAPNLTALNLKFCVHLLGALTLSAGSLSQLKKLHLDFSNISITNLEILLKGASYLKKIFLMHCNDLSGVLTLEQGSLPHLEKIVLSGSYITIENKETLFKAAPNLKKIDLHGRHHLSGTLTLLANSLSSLKILRLGESNISTNNLDVFLKAAPNLEELHLSACENLSGELALLECSLLQLKILYLEKSNINGMSFEILLKAAPHVKKIFLEEDTYLSNALLLLDKLEHLSLKKSNISCADLEHLLKRGANLKKLYLVDCSNLSGELVLEEGCLLQLEILDLSRSDISCASLKTLLKAAPNLRKIDLGNCNLSDLSTAEKDILLEQLEVLNLDGADIKMIELQRWFSVAPHLKRINLDSLTLTGALMLQEGGMPKLEHIIINTSIKNLEILFKAAPNLKGIQLSGEYFSDVLILAKNSLPYLQGINLYAAPMSTENLNTLLAAAPNLPYSLAELEDMQREEDSSSDEELESLSSDTVPPYSKGDEDDAVWIDANTQSQELHYSLVSLFHPIGTHPTPHPSNYRGSVYQTVNTNQTSCTIDKAFSLSHEGGIALVPVSIPYSARDVFFDAEALPSSEGSNLFYSTQRLRVGRDWQAVTSLSPHESMLCYHVEPACTLAIAYSPRDNMYYVRSDKTHDITIDFLIKVPNTPVPVPKDISDFMQELRAWKSKEVATLDVPMNATGVDYFRALYDQKKGACRHRALVFKAWMLRHHSEIPTRIVLNDCHAFAEILWKGIWHPCDLGGYTIECHIEELTIPKVLTPLPHFDRYMRSLETWNRTSSPMPLDVYFTACCQGLVKRRLIQCDSMEDTEALSQGLWEYAQKKGRAVFYAHSPRDLQCASPYIQRINESYGRMRVGPGGPLYDFLQAHPDGMILVNYDTFKADELVSFNTLLDEIPRVDGIILSPSMFVVGVRSKHHIHQAGGEFFSRFDPVEDCPISHEDIYSSSIPFPQEVLLNQGESYVINLYHASDWKERLLGRWIPVGDGWRYITGALENALKASAKNIEISGGCWDDAHFCHEISMLQRAHKECCFTRSTGYDWSSYAVYAHIMDTLPAPGYVVLNMAHLSYLFHQYDIKDDNTLDTVAGYIPRASKKSVSIRVTHALTEHAWAMLLGEAAKHEVHLEIFLDEGVLGPQALGWTSAATPIPVLSAWPNGGLHTVVMQSDDVSASIAKLEQDYPEALKIDGSECQISDLLTGIKPRIDALDDTYASLLFERVYCVLQKSLSEGKTVILYGHATQSLAEQLAPFFIGREHMEAAPGRVIVCTENSRPYAYLAAQYTHIVSPEERAHLLASRIGSIPEALLPDIAHCPLSLLEAKYRFMQKNTKTWEEALALSDKEARSDTLAHFIEDRLALVYEVLVREPYVFLMGLSGSGKTTFVHEILAKQKDISFYEGEGNILAWAMDKGDTLKILFIDEANLSQSDWTIFSDLYHNPPSICIQGQYYSLTKEHKVVFAGNPLNYQGSRKEARFFKTTAHGNQMVFHPLPAMIVREMLLPILEGSLWEGRAEDILSPLLAVYTFLQQCSSSDVLISLRELKTILLLSLVYAQSHPAEDMNSILRYFSYQIAYPLVPKDKKREFHRCFAVERSLALSAPIESGHYLYTPSRHHVITMLESYLALQAAQKIHPISGALGGFILEGAPGQGKSELLLRHLRATHTFFYHIPAGMAAREKEILLRKAFDDGAIVLIDEINTSHIPESLLNALLMGRTPEGLLPTKPGFMLIGTQNPIYLQGRTAFTTAFSRRFHIMSIDPYNTQEMIDILKNIPLPEPLTHSMVSAYEQQVAYAQEKHVYPMPNFRDLMQLAKKEASILSVSLEAGASALRAPAVKHTREMASDVADSSQGFFKRARSSTSSEDLTPAAASKVPY